MRFNSTIDLLKIIHTQDDVGNDVETIEKRKTLAEKKSVKQSEFYQAATAGLKPEIVFVLWSQEYKWENKLEYDGKIYSIIRVYEKQDKIIELVCEVKTGG